MNKRLISGSIAFLTIFLLHSFASFAKKTEVKDKTQLAKTPPIGWNSYNCSGGNVIEAEVKANADYMDKNLKLYGWGSPTSVHRRVWTIDSTGQTSSYFGRW